MYGAIATVLSTSKCTSNETGNCYRLGLYIGFCNASCTLARPAPDLEGLHGASGSIRRHTVIREDDPVKRPVSLQQRGLVQVRHQPNGNTKFLPRPNPLPQPPTPASASMQQAKTAVHRTNRLEEPPTTTLPLLQLLLLL